MSRTTDILRRHAREEALLERVDAGYQPRPAWHQHAYCLGADTNKWFATGSDYLQAEQVCRTCPVRVDCLVDALEREVALPEYVHGIRAISATRRKQWIWNWRTNMGDN